MGPASYLWCRYAHDLSDKPTGSSVEAPQGDKARGRNRSSKQSDESTSHVEAKPVRSRGLGHLCGSATEADVTAVSEVVGRTAERLVPRLCTALGCSPRTAACGSPVRAEEIDEGLSLGVESLLKPSGVLPEAKSRAQVNREIKVFHLKQAHRNFLSVEADPETCLTLLRQEVRLGMMTEMSLDEAQKNPNRLYARMALLRKGDGSHRLIEDQLP
ncbi:hypothetical protein FOZ60_012217 [Perkinsus olseni]|uniref:Uncharacterized protein n=1 Tax=Perkinsus olseni TaxID=32597 RepID=A0A7J6NCA8_PEROL|nr:hypothetical protein FOZ60_012217 [Perkinsus olseni]